MNGRCCVVVADSARARVFLAEGRNSNGHRRLVEQASLTNAEYLAHGPEAPRTKTERNTNRQAGPVHPQFEKRGQHRLELERRFAEEIVARTVEIVRGWKEGGVMLVAPSHMLGLLRELMRETLAPQLTFRELAREYIHLTAAQLARQLNLQVEKT